MSNRFMVTRRSVLIGGISATLVGCDPPSGGVGGGSSSGGEASFTGFLPPWAEDVGMFLTMLTIGGPVGGALAGAMRLPRLAYFLRRVGALADEASVIPDMISVFNRVRSERFALPALSASPRPFIVPENGSINDFESVPIFSNDVSLQFGLVNEEGGNFGPHDIYATIKRVDEPLPQTLSDVFGSADLPHVIISPAPNGNWHGRLDIGRLPPGAFVSYSWRVPRGQQPTDDYIASTAFIGPAFLSTGDADYSMDIGEDGEIGRNVEARFQLPDASLI